MLVKGATGEMIQLGRQLRKYSVALNHCIIIAPPCGAFDLGLAVSVPLPIVMGIFVLQWFQSRLT